MNSSLLGQVALIIVAIILIVSFIQPTLTEVGDTQDSLFEVNDAISKVEFFNTEMRDRLATIDAIPLADMDALDTFLPTDVDVLGVMSDIDDIAELASINVRELSSGSAGGSGSSGGAGEGTKSAETFNVTLVGSYTAFKNFLVLTEYNHYPLSVRSIEIGAVQSAADSETEVGASQTSDPASNQTFSLTIEVPMFTPNEPVPEDELLVGTSNI